MSPRITLSIPLDLSRKMERWKDKFNFSSVFQAAISREIEKKENFAKKIKDEPKIEAIIERLREEKMEQEKEFYEIGRQDGLAWAKQASYQELKYVINEYEVMTDIKDNIISYDPTRNEILGDYFSDIFEEYKERGIGFINKNYSNSIPNNNFQEWEKGWKEAIKEFWEEIEDKI